MNYTLCQEYHPACFEDSFKTSALIDEKLLWFYFYFNVVAPIVAHLIAFTLWSIDAFRR